MLVAFYGISPRGKCLIISILRLQFSASILSHFPSFLRPSGGSRGGGRRSTKERWWRPPVSTTRLHHCGAGSVARAAARSIGAHLDPALTQSLSKRGEREVERLEEQEEGRLISTLAARDRMLPAQVAKDPDLHPVVVVLHHPAHMAAPHFAPLTLLTVSFQKLAASSPSFYLMLGGVTFGAVQLVLFSSQNIWTSTLDLWLSVP